MNITFEELRRIKHALPTGSIARIANELEIDEQTVRNYFGAHNYQEGQIVEWHLEPGPNGGIVHLEDTKILDRAKEILGEHHVSSEN
ncbi:MAG: DNA-binding protein [Saprospiraceae bacterium]